MMEMGDGRGEGDRRRRMRAHLERGPARAPLRISWRRQRWWNGDSCSSRSVARWLRQVECYEGVANGIEETCVLSEVIGW